MTWTIRPRSRSGGIAHIGEGSGTNVLFIHGVGLRAEAWNAQLDAFSGHFRALAADMPGHGESCRIEGTADLGAFTARLAGMLDEPAVVIGHSMGAMIALDLAIHCPQQVLGVAALNAVYRRSEAEKRTVRKRAEALFLSREPDLDAPITRWFGSEMSEERRACETWLGSVSLEGYGAAYRVFAEEDGPVDADLERLACRALFMTGGLEKNSRPDMSEAMAALAPQGRCRVINEAAHMMPMTHPEQVNEVLLNFARECAE